MKLTDEEKQALSKSLMSEDETPQEQQAGLSAFRKFNLMMLLKNNVVLPESHPLYKDLQAAKAEQAQESQPKDNVIYVHFGKKSRAAAASNKSVQGMPLKMERIKVNASQIEGYEALYNDDVVFDASFEVSIKPEGLALRARLASGESVVQKDMKKKYVLKVVCTVIVTSELLEEPWVLDVHYEMRYVPREKMWKLKKQWVKHDIEGQLDVSKLDDATEVDFQSKMIFEPRS